MSRSATVMESTASAGGLELRFRGQWLKGAGFELGQRVNVERFAGGGLLITPWRPKPSDAEVEFAVVAHRLDHAIAMADGRSL